MIKGRGGQPAALESGGGAGWGRRGSPSVREEQEVELAGNRISRNSVTR